MWASLENKKHVLEQSAVQLLYHKVFDYANHEIVSWSFLQ